MSRRRVLRTLGVATAAVPMISLFACDDATTTTDAGTDGATDATVVTDGSSTTWASGGTAAMTAAASYPNPFADSPLTTCALTCAMTEGPCYDTQTISREDVSEGQPGLPVRLMLRLVDETCTPITGADVDIWHCNDVGLYSSKTVNNVGFCTDNDAAALASHWFRG